MKNNALTLSFHTISTIAYNYSPKTIQKISDYIVRQQSNISISVNEYRRQSNEYKHAAQLHPDQAYTLETNEIDQIKPYHILERLPILNRFSQKKAFNYRTATIHPELPNKHPNELYYLILLSSFIQKHLNTASDYLNAWSYAISFHRPNTSSLLINSLVHFYNTIVDIAAFPFKCLMNNLNEVMALYHNFLHLILGFLFFDRDKLFKDFFLAIYDDCKDLFYFTVNISLSCIKSLSTIKPSSIPSNLKHSISSMLNTLYSMIPAKKPTDAIIISANHNRGTNPENHSMYNTLYMLAGKFFTYFLNYAYIVPALYFLVITKSSQIIRDSGNPDEMLSVKSHFMIAIFFTNIASNSWIMKTYRSFIQNYFPSIEHHKTKILQLLLLSLIICTGYYMQIGFINIMFLSPLLPFILYTASDEMSQPSSANRNAYEHIYLNPAIVWNVTAIYFIMYHSVFELSSIEFYAFMLVIPTITQYVSTSIETNLTHLYILTQLLASLISSACGIIYGLVASPAIDYSDLANELYGAPVDSIPYKVVAQEASFSADNITNQDNLVTLCRELVRS